MALFDSGTAKTYSLRTADTTTTNVYAIQDIARAATIRLVGEGDSVLVEGLSSEFTVHASKTKVMFVSATQTITVDLTRSTGAQKVVFVDGEYSLVKGAKSITANGTALSLKQVELDSIDATESNVANDYFNPVAPVVVAETFTLTTGAASVVEGGTAVLTLTLDKAPTSAVTVVYATAAGTADTADYVSTAGTVTFAAGQRTAFVTVATTQDSAVEAAETFTVNFSGAQLTASAAATVTITNDDVAPVVVVTPLNAILTAGVDGINGGTNFTGTTVNDTFAAVDGAWSALDVIDGVSGNDTFTIGATAAITGTPVAARVLNIDTLNISSSVVVAGNGVTLNTTGDAANYTGLSALNVTTSGAGATQTLTTGAGVNVTATGAAAITINGGNAVTAVTSSGDLTIGTTTRAVGAVSATHAAAAAAGTQAISGGSSQIINITGAALTDGQTGSAVNAGTTTGPVTLTVANTSSAAVDTDVAAGGILTVAGGSSVIVNQSIESTAAAALTILTGSDTVTLTQGAVDINGTASTTSVTVNQSAARTAVNSATVGVSGIVAGGVTVDDVNAGSLTLAGTIATVTLNNAGAAIINSGALTTLNLAGTLTTVDAGTLGALTTPANTALAVNLNGAVSNGALTIDTDIRTINITATGTANGLANLVNASATAVNVAGTSALTIAANTLAAGAVITSTNTSGLLITQELLAGQQFVGTASSGADSIAVGASTVAHTTGAGNDTVTISAAMGTGGSINAGDGDADLLVMTGTLADALDANTTFNGTVSGFERLSLTASDTRTLNLANLDGLNHVTIATANQTTILQGATTGATLALINAQNGDTNTVTLAVNGAADVLNVTLTNGGNIDYGTVVATGFETVAITATESGALTANVIDTATVALTNANATSITVGGNANLALTADSTVLTRLDASANLRGGVNYTTGILTTASTLTGGAGANTLDAKAAVAAVTATGGAANDTLLGSRTVSSTLNGAGGNDTLTGGAAADVINGGDGTDTFVFSSTTFVEQAGSGTVQGVVINLGANALTAGDVFTATGDFISGVALSASVASNTATYLFDNESNTNASVVDTLTSIENATGTEQADYIVGSATANALSGAAGVDTIVGGAGNDTITGGTGADRLTGGADADTFVYHVADDSTDAAMDAISDFVAADRLSFDTTADGAVTNDAAVAGAVDDEFVGGMATGALAAAIAADVTLADALTEFLAAASFDNNDVGGFVFQGNSYIVHADADGAAGNIVRLTGITVTAIAEVTTTDVFSFTIA